MNSQTTSPFGEVKRDSDQMQDDTFDESEVFNAFFYKAISQSVNCKK